MAAAHCGRGENNLWGQSIKCIFYFFVYFFFFLWTTYWALDRVVEAPDPTPGHSRSFTVSISSEIFKQSTKVK